MWRAILTCLFLLTTCSKACYGATASQSTRDLEPGRLLHHLTYHKDDQCVMICEDDATCCPDPTFTCCPMPGTPTGVGCCPMPNAVCCPDGTYCCPEDFICTGRGSRGGCALIRPVDPAGNRTITRRP